MFTKYFYHTLLKTSKHTMKNFSEENLAKEQIMRQFTDKGAETGAVFYSPLSCQYAVNFPSGKLF